MASPVSTVCQLCIPAAQQGTIIITPLDQLRACQIPPLHSLLLLGLRLAVEQVQEGDRIQEIGKEYHRPNHDIEGTFLVWGTLFRQECVDGDQYIVGYAVDDLEHQV